MSDMNIVQKIQKAKIFNENLILQWQKWPNKWPKFFPCDARHPSRSSRRCPLSGAIEACATRLCSHTYSVGLRAHTSMCMEVTYKCHLLGLSLPLAFAMVNGLLFHMTQPTSRSIIKAIACSKPIVSEHWSKRKHNGTIVDQCKQRGGAVSYRIGERPWQSSSQPTLFITLLPSVEKQQLDIK